MGHGLVVHNIYMVGLGALCVIFAGAFAPDVESGE